MIICDTKNRRIQQSKKKKSNLVGGSHFGDSKNIASVIASKLTAYQAVWPES